MRLLIVEDEPKARAYLQQGLVEAGFAVDVAADGDAGLAAVRAASARGGPYALVICDVMMPSRDGFGLVGALRREAYSTPVLMVTARADVDSRVRGLDLGADDYLTKPFAFAELLARVRALLRRGASGPLRAPDVYRVADLVCDPRTRRVERGGRRIDLTPKEFALLQLLLEHQGEVVPRTLLADRVWGMNFDSDTNVIDVHVRRLRTKLDVPAGATPLVHTVRGAGYVIEDRAAAPPPARAGVKDPVGSDASRRSEPPMGEAPDDGTGRGRVDDGSARGWR